MPGECRKYPLRGAGHSSAGRPPPRSASFVPPHRWRPTCRDKCRGSRPDRPSPTLQPQTSASISGTENRGRRDAGDRHAQTDTAFDRSSFFHNSLGLSSGRLPPAESPFTEFGVSGTTAIQIYQIFDQAAPSVMKNIENDAYLPPAPRSGQPRKRKSRTTGKRDGGTENSRPPPALARNLQEKPRRQPGTGTGARKATSVFKSRPCTFHVHIESESSPLRPALLCMAAEPGGRPHVREKPENAGNRRRYRCGRPPGCRTDRLAGCRRPSRRQATGSGVRRRSGRRLRVEIRDRQIPAGRTRRAGLPVHSLGGRLRRSIVHPTTLRLEIRSSGLRAGRLCRLEPHRSRRAKTRHLGRARRSGFGSGLRLPVYEALPQTENIVRRRSDRFGRRMRRSPRRPRVLNHPSANGQIEHVRRAAQCQRSSIEPCPKRTRRSAEHPRASVRRNGRPRAAGHQPDVGFAFPRTSALVRQADSHAGPKRMRPCR